MTASKVRFGLKNVHYALMTDEGYDKPVKIPGAVSLTLNTEGSDASIFYADDIAYWTLPASNSGYTGTLTMAIVPDSFKVAALGEVVDDNGIQVELSDAQPKPFALLYEVSGDADEKRYAFYNTTASRTAPGANTKSDSTSPDTEELNFTAIGKDFEFDGETKNIVKGSAPTEAKAYAAWFETVQTPTKAKSESTGA